MCSCAFFHSSPLFDFDVSRLGNAAADSLDAPAQTDVSLQSFRGKNILVLIPHEDDEACLLGGVLESFVKAGSNVRVVYETNGDFRGKRIGLIRIQEAIHALEIAGIPKENILFLGYGDQWEGDVHIYNAAPDEVLTSAGGLTKTYGSDDMPAYHDGTPYTRNNLKSDIRSVLTGYLPDIIFCIDLDGHRDHRGLSLLFEEVMGDLLRESPEYQPAVFKGFGYSTAWNADADFAGENLSSTVQPEHLSFSPEFSYYNWYRRIRFPVSSRAVSRLMTHSTTYRMLDAHASQNAVAKSASVLNGDRVFWLRPTQSLLYRAIIKASSGEASRLTDFKLADIPDVNEVVCTFSDHVWSPAPQDSRKTISVHFNDPVTLSQIWLYDNPDWNSNILESLITFSDGTEILTGPLDVSGCPTAVSFPEKESITSMTIRILEAEGDEPGLVELEAYSEDPSAGLSWIKLMNEKDDLIYDYWINRTGSENLRLYRYPEDIDFLETNVAADISSSAGSVEIAGDTVKVFCPPGESFYLSVTDKRNDLSDTVRISNPSEARRLLVSILQKLESDSVAAGSP